MKKPPLMLGIVGDDGAGKATFVRGIVRLLGARGVTPICLDDYARYSRADQQARGLTLLDPACSDLERMVEQLAALRAGNAISKPVYDQRSGELRESELVAPTGLVIAHGLHTLASPALIDLFDLTLYLEPDEQLRHAWQTQRDVAQQRATARQLEAQHSQHERDAVRFIRPQRASADIVVHFFWDAAVSKAAGAAFGVRLVQRHRATRLDLTEALSAFQQPATVRQQFGVRDDDGSTADMIELDAALSPVEATALEAAIWRELPELPPLPPEQIGQVHVGRELRRSPTLALVQLLVAHQLVQAGQR